MRGLDTITLQGLRSRGKHGVLEHERRDGQDFVVDVTVWVDLRAAGSSDALEDTVDYATLASEVIDIVAGPPVNLLETLASQIADKVLSHPSVVEAEISVHKPQAPLTVPFEDVVVTIRRLSQ